jgi:biopolymer transport protein ExbB
MDIIARGGVVMVLILLLSLVAAVIIIERLLYLRSSRVDEERLIQRLSGAIAQGQYEEALAICAHPSPLASLMRTGIENRHLPRSELREAILDAAQLEIPRQERFVSALGTIATIAPLLGLLGTVTGNINAFGVLSNLDGIADGSQLARGISEALLTTAAGIIVSIPATVFYNYLVNKVSHRTILLENRVNELVLLLADAERAAAAGERVGRRTGDPDSLSSLAVTVANPATTISPDGDSEPPVGARH